MPLMVERSVLYRPPLRGQMAWSDHPFLYHSVDTEDVTGAWHVVCAQHLYWLESDHHLVGHTRLSHYQVFYVCTNLNMQSGHYALMGCLSQLSLELQIMTSWDIRNRKCYISIDLLTLFDVKYNYNQTSTSR